MSVERRHRPYGLLGAAAAVVALGAAGVVLAGAGGGGGAGSPAGPAPGAPAQVRPVVFDPTPDLHFQTAASPPVAAVRAQR